MIRHTCIYYLAKAWADWRRMRRMRADIAACIAGREADCAGSCVADAFFGALSRAYASGHCDTITLPATYSIRDSVQYFRHDNPVDSDTPSFGMEFLRDCIELMLESADAPVRIETSDTIIETWTFTVLAERLPFSIERVSLTEAVRSAHQERFMAWMKQFDTYIKEHGEPDNDDPEYQRLMDSEPQSDGPDEMLRVRIGAAGGAA